MSHEIVKFLINDDGDDIPLEDQVWYYSHLSVNANMAFCTGEFYGYGDSSVQYVEQTVESGGITCQQCLAKIRMIQSIKLEATQCDQ